MSYDNPPPYGQEPYGGPQGYPQQPPQTNPLAVTSLVTGIIGVLASCFCWFIPVLPIAALITGFIGRKQVRTEPQRYSGGGMGTAGLILGIVGLVLSVAFLVLVVAFGTFDYTFETSP